MELMELERREVANHFGHNALVGELLPDALFGAVSSFSRRAAGQAQLQSQSWAIKYSVDMPKAMTPLSGGGWSFDFPQVASPFSYTQYPQYPPEVGYVTTGARTPITLGASLTMSLTVSVTGSPTFNFQMESGNTGTTPANVRPYFSDKNDNGGATDRWWANPTDYTLAAGTATLTVPMTPDQWSDVNGQFGTANPAAFQHALQNVTDVGFTFGGGSFFGHGVNVSGGGATFVLNSFAIG